MRNKSVVDWFGELCVFVGVGCVMVIMISLVTHFSGPSGADALSSVPDLPEVSSIAIRLAWPDFGG